MSVIYHLLNHCALLSRENANGIKIWASVFTEVYSTGGQIPPPNKKRRKIVLRVLRLPQYMYVKDNFQHMSMYNSLLGMVLGEPLKCKLFRTYSIIYREFYHDIV